MEVAHIDVFHSEPERFWSFYAQRFATLGQCEPNEAHGALVELERRGLLDGVVTQNIDTLHRKAGTREVVEVHGSIESCVCLGCERHVALDEVLVMIAGARDGVPRCVECSRPLKPEVVLFGEMLPERALMRAQELCAGADLLLCIGSSLEVYPVAALPELTLASGGDIAIVTQGSTPLDHLAEIRLTGDVVEELHGLLGAL